MTTKYQELVNRRDALLNEIEILEKLQAYPNQLALAAFQMGVSLNHRFHLQSDTALLQQVDTAITEALARHVKEIEQIDKTLEAVEAFLGGGDATN